MDYERQVRLQAERDRACYLARCAAHLVAALSGKDTGVPLRSMTAETRDSFTVLRQELAADGYLRHYRNERGEFSLT